MKGRGRAMKNILGKKRLVEINKGGVFIWALKGKVA